MSYNPHDTDKGRAPWGRCIDCKQQFKHVGNNVWVDDTDGDCFFETNEIHRLNKKGDV